MEKIKKCLKCGIEKSLDDFGHNKKNLDGHERWCRSCRSTYQKAQISKKLRLQNSANGRRRQGNKKPVSKKLPVPAIGEAITLPLEAIHAIKKSIAQDIAKFIMEKYA